MSTKIYEAIGLSLGIGCPVGCLEYCPQEVTVKRYGKEKKRMSLEDFYGIISTIPKSVCLSFAGFYEPFCNPDFVSMVEKAQAEGFETRIFTTLMNAKSIDVVRLVSMSHKEFCLHLNDGKHVHFPLTEEYKDNLCTVIQKVPNLTFSLMNELFKTCNRENMARGVSIKPRHIGYCDKLVIPEFEVLPNGDVYLCCMDFGLQHRLGNLLEQDYLSIKESYRNKSYSLCKICPNYMSYLQVTGKRIIRLCSKNLGYSTF